MKNKTPHNLNIIHRLRRAVFKLATGISAKVIHPARKSHTVQPRRKETRASGYPGIARGIGVAAKDLQLCIEPRKLPNGEIKHVLCAGHINFREPWARDLSFAAYGLLELGDYKVVRQSLEVFLHFQTASGQFPVKVYSVGILDRYLHSVFGLEQPTGAPLRPKYISGHRTLSLDVNLLLVIACLHYITKTGDEEFARQNWPALKRGIAWVEKHGERQNGLVSQQAYSDWEDSLALTGEVLYTNIVYWKALHEMARHAPLFGIQGEQADWQKRSQSVYGAIQEHFWHAELGYYVTSDEMKNLSAAGNLLAVSWELASPAQGRTILAKMLEFRMANPVPTQATYGEIPVKDIAIENRLAGIPEYHTHGAWLWLGAWHVIAEIYQDNIKEAHRLLKMITDVVWRDQAVYEVYGLDGLPLSTHWYSAEAPLTWSAGMIIYAHHVYRRHLAYKNIVIDDETA